MKSKIKVWEANKDEELRKINNNDTDKQRRIREILRMMGKSP